MLAFLVSYFVNFAYMPALLINHVKAWCLHSLLQMKTFSYWSETGIKILHQILWN